MPQKSVAVQFLLDCHSKFSTGEECADETIARDFAVFRWEELGPSLLLFAHIVSRLSHSHSNAGVAQPLLPLLPMAIVESYLE